MSANPLSQPPALTPEIVERARTLSLAGATRQQIAEALGVSMAVLRVWRLAYPHFADALDEWRAEADDDVERALWAQAISGDVAAARFWLTNRRAAQWRNKADVEQSGALSVTVLTGVPSREERDRE